MLGYPRSWLVDGYELKKVYNLARSLQIGEQIDIELLGKERIVIAGQRDISTSGAIKACFVDQEGNETPLMSLSNNSLAATALDNQGFKYLRLKAVLAIGIACYQIQFYNKKPNIRSQIL